MRIGGVDGCPSGWLRIEECLETGVLEARICISAEELVEDIDEFQVLAIDIPIGLSQDDSRPCDVAARQLLRPKRSSSVFPAPVRPVLGAASYREAVARSRAACGKAMSKQAFAITDRIADIDRILQSRRELRGRIREVHPEVCFHFLAGGRPMAFPKRTPEGAAERDALLTPIFGEAFADIRRALPRYVAADDDIRDALVALWTARRILRGEAVTVPASPTRDATGLPMEMVA